MGLAKPYKYAIDITNLNCSMTGKKILENFSL